MIHFWYNVSYNMHSLRSQGATLNYWTKVMFQTHQYWQIREIWADIRCITTFPVMVSEVHSSLTHLSQPCLHSIPVGLCWFKLCCGCRSFSLRFSNHWYKSSIWEELRYAQPTRGQAIFGPHIGHSKKLDQRCCVSFRKEIVAGVDVFC